MAAPLHRRDQRQRSRWGILAGVLLVACLWGPTRTSLTVLWVIGNGLLAIYALGWGLGYLAILRPARQVGLRWAGWLALLAPLAFGISLANMAAQQTIVYARAGVLGAALLVPLLFLLSCPVLLFGSFLGAALGGIVEKLHWAPEGAATTGVRVWWIICLLAMAMLGSQPGLRTISLLLLAGLPAISVGCCCLIHPRVPLLREKIRGMSKGISRLLVWRWSRGGTRRTLDLRGAAFGVLAVLLVQLAAAAGFLRLPQAASLLSLIQIRNMVVQSVFHSGNAVRVALSALHASPDAAAGIVLLKLDASTLHEALSTGSEAEVQARIIQLLRGDGAAWIVAPAPLVESSSNSIVDPEIGPDSRQDAPEPSTADKNRSLRDLPALTSAVSRAGNVLISAPFGLYYQTRGDTTDIGDPRPTRRSLDELAHLFQAAHAVGDSELSEYLTAQLPAISVYVGGPQHPILGDYSPLPLQVLAALRGRPLRPHRLSSANQVSLAGERVSAVGKSRVTRGTEVLETSMLLPDYTSIRPGRDFQQVSYSSVFRGEALHTAAFPGAPETRWVSPNQFFKGKVVFLDSLAPGDLLTPLGEMPESEELAYATASLLSSSLISRASGAGFLLCCLALGIIVGAVCSGIDPLRSAWRTACILILTMGASVFVFMTWRTWWDPVVMALTVILSAVLVTQLTFAIQRSEREQHRALLQRFVSPQVVDELLEDWEGLGLGGRRQTVCVLFADFRSFTSFAERHSPEEVVERTNEYLTAMTDALFAYGGMLDKYTGDGLMALFPVRGEPGDDVQRATRAAVAMRDVAEAINTRLVAGGKEPLRVGFGVHFGEAIVGLVGSPSQFNYTALGHTVIISQRLQTLAGPGEVIASENVHAVMAGIFPAVQVDAVSVKGIADPIRPYRILALPPAPAGSNAMPPDLSQQAAG